MPNEMNEETTAEPEMNEFMPEGASNRRTFLTRLALAGVGAAALKLGTSAQAADKMMGKMSPVMKAGPKMPITAANVMTEAQFRQGVLGPATLSLLTSQIAVTKATQKNAKEFAGFELTEAIAVTTVLKDLKTPQPPMDAKAKATLEKIKSTPVGPEFDKAFITAQYENHVYLRDLAAGYLKHSAGKTSPDESQGRHLATLSLAVFKEHVMITHRILGELKA